MIKTTALSLVGAFCTPLLFAEIYSYEIKEVEALEVGAGVELEIRCGDMNKLEISADSEDDFSISFENKKLKITGRNRRTWWPFFARRHNDVTANLTLKNPPQFIEVHAGSEGDMKNCFKNEADLGLSVSAGSSFELDGGSGSLNKLKVDLSSGSSVEIRETFHINHIELKASSGSKFEAGNKVVIEAAEVRVYSGASAEICGTFAVSVRASSGGSVKVSENTIRTDFSVSSGGSDSDCR